ncbi:MAG: long-chain fatty acid--CoA ligase [Spirochaetia bacterium]|nr:long-chain fatty acid--CoA ligase [Spirochaetia bacterium]
MQTIAQMFHANVQRYPDLDVIWERKSGKGAFVPVTYLAFEKKVLALATGLRQLGIRRGDMVAILADNSSKWLLSDLALQYLGATDVPRGTDATDQEILQILSTCEAHTCFAADQAMLARLEKLKEQLPALQRVIILQQKDTSVPCNSFEVIDFNSLLVGIPSSSSETEILAGLADGQGEDIATVIFTSGTTGLCKGVMLTHGNFMYQFRHLQQIVDGAFQPGQRWLSVLPIWHIFERMATYVALSYGQCIAYSKPLGSRLMLDFKQVEPHWFASVPRIWEMIYKGVWNKVERSNEVEKAIGRFSFAVGTAYRDNLNIFNDSFPDFGSGRKKSRTKAAVKVALLFPFAKFADAAVFSKLRKNFGPNLIAGVSGGGSLPAMIDRFFDACGIRLLDGYGMTETGPIISVRRLHGGRLGAMSVLDGTRVRILKDDGSEASIGEKGVLWVNGPQVMKGYFKMEGETKKVFDKEGFLNTGDLVRKTVSGEIVIAGRAKDTIVLAGGENLEPVPIEAKILEDDVFANAVVIGQDRKFLSALVVLDPANIKEYLASANLPTIGTPNYFQELRSLILRRIEDKVNIRAGFKKYEQIAKVYILDKPFEVGKELSAKHELKRFAIEKLYQKEINALYT